MSLKQIAQNSSLVEDLFGTAAEMGAALINDQDWFGSDSLLEKIPYGKIVGWIIQKAVVIDDVDKAFNHAYAMAYFLCFSQAVKRYKFFLKGTDLVEIKEVRQAETLFSLNDFELIESAIFTHYTNKYKALLKACKISDKASDTVINYIRWNLKIVFHELLENKPTTYKKLCEELDRASFSLRNEKLQITQYYQEQKNLFLSPVMGDEQGMTLEKVYVEPNYRIHRVCVDKNLLDKDFRESEFVDSERNQNIVFVESKSNEYNSVHGLLNDFVTDRPIKDRIKCPNTNTLVLLGYPGQGKTSSIRKLLFDLIEDAENPRLVFHLPLRTITNVSDFCNAPFEVIEEHIKEKNIPVGYAKQLVRKGLIILEGLDELAIQSGTKEKTIDEVVRELLRVQDVRTDVKLIITSRLGYLDCTKFEKKNLVILQLKEFDSSKQIEWLGKYKAFYPKCKITNNHIKQFNKEDHHLKELINQPILLHMVVSSEIKITSKANRAKLYESLFSSLIERKWATERKEDKHVDKQIDLLKGLGSEDLREIIQDMALAIFHSGRNCIQKNEIEELGAVKRHITQKLGFDKLGGALKGVMVAFYFQEVEQKEGNGNLDYGIEFLHKSLSEYMAAEKIWKEMKGFLEFSAGQRRFTIDSLKQALEKLNDLFAPQMLTLEVRDYIWEIMKNDLELEWEKLGDRLSFFLPELLRKEFLWEYDAGKHDYPIQRALNTFYGYWTVLSCIAEQLNRNYLAPEFKEDFVRVLRSCLFISPPNISLSHQDLSGAELSGAELYVANLSEANLSGAKLDGAKLVGANFYEAKLISVMLNAADLFAATLTRAELSQAILYRAILEKADLSEANLSEANLFEADLSRANLYRANLYKANLYKANLNNLSLEGVIFKDCVMDQVNYDLLKEQGFEVPEDKVLDLG